MNIEDCIIEVILNSLADDDLSVNSILNDMSDGMNKDEMQQVITKIDNDK
jgi:hypothetical protein